MSYFNHILFEPHCSHHHYFQLDLQFPLLPPLPHFPQTHPHSFILHFLIVLISLVPDFKLIQAQLVAIALEFLAQDLFILSSSFLLNLILNDQFILVLELFLVHSFW